jgi:cellulose synthase/poly-beta-1,6-N-acetylglucosamine synthase-like glycosyltransferase
MIDLELPLGKRSLKYRMFEMLPAIISYGALILLVVLSLISPILAAVYLMLVIITLLVKAAGIAYHTIYGRARLEDAQKVDWHQRLVDMQNAKSAYEHHSKGRPSKEFKAIDHIENLRLATADSAAFPKPSELYNAVIVAAYNEAYEIIEPTIQAILDNTYDQKRLILTFAYEERGGEGIKKTAALLKKKFGSQFFAFHTVQHPKDMPNEVIGKGGNITYAGFFLKDWLKQQQIEYKNVIVTTLDCDNRPHASYFDYVTYEYIVHEDRKHLSFQPISLFLNNIWDAPALMRVIATGNSFWNIISSMRPHLLRNFASHSQPMEALVEMDFWSTRTIVEDGHQYWRSYFYFNGNYDVIPLHIPIYQDAVLAETYIKTLKAQFLQVRRWTYGASDVPYVAVHIFSRNRNVPLFAGLGRLLRLIDGHVTWATVSILTAFGAWVPLLINSQAHSSLAANQLPDFVSHIQQVALVGLLVTVFFSLKMLPPRPARYKRHRTVLMVLQWFLMPFTSIVYGSVAALYSQTRLLTGRYLDHFDVTVKVTRNMQQATKDAAKSAKKARRDAKHA